MEIKEPRLPVNKNTIIRTRIDELLKEGMQYHTLVLSADAGYGKTQAVASFLEHSNYINLWLQFTELDNTAMIFFKNFIQIIELVKPELSVKMEEFGFPDSTAKYYGFLQLMTKELYLEEEMVAFVLSDLHLIKDESVKRFIEYLLSANLANITFIVLTRDKDLSIFPQDIYIVSTEDLRFTLAEYKQYVLEKHIGLDDDEAYSVHVYTQGWPLALGLISARVNRNEMEFTKRLGDSKQAIFQLIDKDIFSKYTSVQKEFLCIIAKLAFYPKDLVLRIGKLLDTNALDVLKDNMFISYDSNSDAYYIHDIFRDFILKSDYSIDAKTMSDANLLAGDWCYENKKIISAINYFEKCDDMERIALVIQGIKGNRVSFVEAKYLIEYIEKMPEEFLQKHYMCRIVYSTLLLNNLELDKAKQQIDILCERLYKNRENDSMLGEALMAAGLVSMGLGNGEYVEYFKEASKHLPNGSSYIDNTLRLIEYGNSLTFIDPTQGSIEKSLADLNEGISYISKVLNGVGTGGEYLGLAEAYFLRGNFGEAEKAAYDAIFVAQTVNESDIINSSLFLLLRIFISQGAIEQINEIVLKIKKRMQGDKDFKQYTLDIALAWLNTEISNTKEVPSWIIDNEIDSLPPISLDKDVLFQVRYFIEKGKFHKASALINKLESTLKKRNTLLSIIYTMVYKAIVEYALQNYDVAKDALIEAYQLSHQNKITMPFIEYGQRTRAMLTYFKEHCPEEIDSVWIEEMHRKASTYAKRNAFVTSKLTTSNNTQLEHNLTRREQELLLHMSQGLTRDEIAECMQISSNTVKSMTKAIYNKLGAVNGADAIRIAGTLDILV